MGKNEYTQDKAEDRSRYEGGDMGDSGSSLGEFWTCRKELQMRGMSFVNFQFR